MRSGWISWAANGVDSYRARAYGPDEGENRDPTFRAGVIADFLDDCWERGSPPTPEEIEGVHAQVER